MTLALDLDPLIEFDPALDLEFWIHLSGVGIGIEKCQKIAPILNPDSDPAVEL